ncbi:MAG: hypothetical protein JST21_07080 [Bacteroidetes bacterium]|nr:hypothetical protein [Bacteroidota bacterium]
MKKSIRIFLAAIFLFSGISCKKTIEPPAANQAVSAFENSSVLKSYGMLGRQYIVMLPTGDYNYTTSQALLWVPPDVLKSPKTKNKYPLIINLYGQGQCGTNLQLMLQGNTMSEYIADGFNAFAKNPKDGKTYSFFVCSPQCPTSWGWSAPQVNVMLQTLIDSLPIDQTRIYITGFSAGGWGLWSCMTDNNSLTKKFAAIVPISSAAADHPDKITNVDKYGIACLNVCGNQDAFYPNAVSYTNIINSNKPPIPAILKTLKGVGHSAWVQAYDPNWEQINNMNIYEWMLLYHK